MVLRSAFGGVARDHRYPHEAIVLASTLVTDDTMIKIYAWYDNEMGYANRIFDVAQHIFAKGV